MTLTNILVLLCLLILIIIPTLIVIKFWDKEAWKTLSTPKKKKNKEE